jgi:hypothetical protein
MAVVSLKFNLQPRVCKATVLLMVGKDNYYCLFGSPLNHPKGEFDFSVWFLTYYRREQEVMSFRRDDYS